MEFKTVQQGAANMVIAAFDPTIIGILSIYYITIAVCASNLAVDKNGGHYDDDNQIKPIPEAYAYAVGIENEERLWKLSEKLVGQNFTY
jgi:hypothetical protein